MVQMLRIMVVLSDETKCTGVLSDQSKKRKTFEVAGCAKKSTVARGSSQDFVAMSFIAVEEEGVSNQRDHSSSKRTSTPAKLQSRLHWD